jgi:mannose-1-phosphate guanylyltransferase
VLLLSLGGNAKDAPGKAWSRSYTRDQGKDRSVIVSLTMQIAAEAASNFGCIVSDTTSNEVLHYVEKPESYISSTINCGVYLFSSKALFQVIRESRTRKQTKENQTYRLFEEGEEDADDERLRLEQDILAPLSQTRKLFVYTTRDFWQQIKTAGSAVPSNALYLQKALQSPSNSSVPLYSKPKDENGPEIVSPVYIHPSAQISPSAKLGPNVSISAGVRILAGARIKDAIILDGAEIKHNACVLHAIVGWDSKVGAWARVEGTPTLASQHSTTIVRGGVKIQSITILAKEVSVTDEVHCQNVIVLPHKEINFDINNEVIVSAAEIDLKGRLLTRADVKIVGLVSSNIHEFHVHDPIFKITFFII